MNDSIGDYRDGTYSGRLHVDVLSGVNFSRTTRIDEGLLPGTIDQGWKRGEAFTVTAGNTLRSFAYQNGDSRDGARNGRLIVEVVTHPYATSGTRVDND